MSSAAISLMYNINLIFYMLQIDFWKRPTDAVTNSLYFTRSWTQSLLSIFLLYFTILPFSAYSLQNFSYLFDSSRRLDSHICQRDFWQFPGGKTGPPKITVYFHINISKILFRCYIYIYKSLEIGFSKTFNFILKTFIVLILLIFYGRAIFWGIFG